MLNIDPIRVFVAFFVDGLRNRKLPGLLLKALEGEALGMGAGSERILDNEEIAAKKITSLGRKYGSYA